ncbi:hypothetical protein CBM2600_B130185 [Cupriavidus taiwanensis]|nr:hypothetical protein CBM2600_B130185 [Cupriavidus taiwanensis]
MDPVRGSRKLLSRDGTRIAFPSPIIRFAFAMTSSLQTFFGVKRSHNAFSSNRESYVHVQQQVPCIVNGCVRYFGQRRCSGWHRRVGASPRAPGRA